MAVSAAGETSSVEQWSASAAALYVDLVLVIHTSLLISRRLCTCCICSTLRCGCERVALSDKDTLSAEKLRADHEEQQNT